MEHPYIREKCLEFRQYQVDIAEVARRESTLVVLPTGLGKTVIALMVIASTIDRGKSLFLAPTKPLVEQHYRFLTEYLIIDDIAMFTGEVSPKKRGKMWRESRVVVSTPQVIENDLLTGRIDLNDVSLIVFDEAHRAVGDYAYVYVASRFRETKPDGLVLGITASPGSRAEKILTVCRNLGITWIEVRTEFDSDVQPYVQRITINWVKVPVPEELKEISKVLEEILLDQLKVLRDYRLIKSERRASTRELLDAQTRLKERLATAQGDERGGLYYAASVQAIAVKVNHAIELAETQGMDALRNYIDRLVREAAKKGASRASKMLVKDPRFQKIMEMVSSHVDHPKVEALLKIVRNQLMESPESRIIVFTHYRDTADLVTKRLNEDPVVSAGRFVGQATKGEDKGMSQKRQAQMIDAFKKGEYNVLVATSVAEEGLDIPSTDLVIFYEPVPSEIRTIQRRGRTGRRRLGRVVILMSGGTRDEAYYWSSIHKERRMKRELERLRQVLRAEGQTALSHPTHAKAAHPSVEDHTSDAMERGIQRPLLPARIQQSDADTRFASTSLTDSRSDLEIQMSTPTVAGSTSHDKMIDETGVEGGGQRTLFDFQVTAKVLADVREFPSKVVKEVSRLGVLVEGRTLEVADYVISSRIGVERKTAEDFVASLIDGRLFGQIRSLSDSFPCPVLIIEGPLLGLRLGETALYGAVATILTEFRVSIINTSGPEETARVLSAMAKREASKGKKSSVRHGRKRAGKDAKLYIVEGLPHVSGTLARRLLVRFGSVKGVMTASAEELQKVKGIGKKRAQEIVRTLEDEW